MENAEAKNHLLIKFVALYLRKSRGDLEKDLEKHRKVLVEKCIENGWKFLVYEELESGESISIRPVMQKLLKDIENGLFDAVLVMDIDRLGRGDMGDQDKIKKVFAQSNTLVVTEKEVYNLNNDDDEFIVDMKGFIARREYKEIVKRLVRGKKVGSRMGMWTNGKPPFPYEYEAYKDKYLEKGIVVNDEKLIVYRFIIDSMLFKGMSVHEISHELNRQKIPSPGGRDWVGITISRIAKDETQLGRIISNKTSGDAHKTKKPNSKPYKVLPRIEWNIVENCHEAVKTIEEHEKILIHLDRITRVPKRSVAKVLPFTGLVICAKCKYKMSIQERIDSNKYRLIKACWYKDSTGHKCGNSGGPMDFLTDIVNKELVLYEDKIINDIFDDEGDDTKEIEGLMYHQFKLIESKEKALIRIQEAYEADVYTLKEFKARKDSVINEIDILREAVKILELKLKHTTSKSNEERIACINKFKEELNKGNLSYEQLNALYKSIIESIEWSREGKDIEVKVNFL